MLLRAGVLAVAAAGFWAVSAVASADVVEPQSATQPAAVGLLEQEAARAAVPVVEEVPQETGVQGAQGEGTGEVVEPTPAPEQVVRPAPARVVNMSNTESPSVVDRVLHPLQMGFKHIGASLGRVVGACETGFGSWTGGPALIFAVLAMVAPFIRRRIFMTRWTADEDVPEFLFAQELTPPG